MKKTIILSLGLIVCLSLSACGNKEAKEKAGAPAGDSAVSTNKSLSDWLKDGEAVECTLNTPEGQVVILGKNGAIRMEGIPYFSPDSSGEMPEAGDGVMLTAGDWTYMWDKKKKQGTKMDNRQFEDIGETEDVPASEQKDWEDMTGEWEAEGVNFDCREADLDDELFAEPEGVEFTDLSALFNDMSEQVDALPEIPAQHDVESLPDLSEFDIPAGMNQEDIEAMIDTMDGEELPLE